MYNIVQIEQCKDNSKGEIAYILKEVQDLDYLYLQELRKQACGWFLQFLVPSLFTLDPRNSSACCLSFLYSLECSFFVDHF